jgi:membrane protease YdiL (CAAX protease family)
MVPLALLALAAVVGPLRLPILVALVAGTAIAVNREAPVRWAWAAAVPVAISLAWGAWLTAPPEADGADCTDPASPLAVSRMAEAFVVLAALGVLAMVLRAPRTSLLLRRPNRAVIRWSVLGFLAAGPLALLLGPLLARPFFGDVGYSVTALGAIVPALLFAAANGPMEELAYRGALLGWSSRVLGVAPALVGQAIVFGLAHSGADVVANGLVLSLALGVGGLLAGLIALRTRSLLLPIAVHVGLDIPIYYAFACPA